MFNIKNMNNIHMVTFNSLTDDDVESFFCFLTNLYNNKNSFKLIFDLTFMQTSDITHLPKILNFMIKHKSDTINYIDKTAIIIKSKTIRSILDNLVFKIHPPVKPNLVTNNLNKAIDFLH